MVAKLLNGSLSDHSSYLLAKIHMVAKPYGFPFIASHKLSSSKNPYGSKTLLNGKIKNLELSSSKNPYGSKTPNRRIS